MFIRLDAGYSGNGNRRTGWLELDANGVRLGWTRDNGSGRPPEGCPETFPAGAIPTTAAYLRELDRWAKVAKVHG